MKRVNCQYCSQVVTVGLVHECPKAADPRRSWSLLVRLLTSRCRRCSGSGQVKTDQGSLIAMVCGQCNATGRKPRAPLASLLQYMWDYYHPR